MRISLTQLMASALAAITATVAASYLGVAGTVIGAAVASVLTVTGTAVYSHSIQRTGSRVRGAVPAAARWSPRPPAPAPDRPPAEPRRQRGTWKVIAAACVGVFAGVLLVITAVELVAGEPLSDLLRGDRGSGTTVLGTVSQRAAAPAPAPPASPVTVTVTPSVVTSTPTVTVTGPPVTRTSTPTLTTTPSSPSTPAPTPTPSSSNPGTSSPGPARTTSP